MARNIFTITLGLDITKEKFDLMCRKDPASSEFEVRSVSLHEAILECIDALISTFAGKLMNPL